MDEPETQECFRCSEPGMTKKQRLQPKDVEFVRVLWLCDKCGGQFWKTYGDEIRSKRESRRRWH
jgi:uncharacterized protein with PIN domain